MAQPHLVAHSPSCVTQVTHTIIEFPERLTVGEAFDIIQSEKAKHPNPNHSDSFRLAAGCVVTDWPMPKDEALVPEETREYAPKPGDRLAGILFV